MDKPEKASLLFIPVQRVQLLWWPTEQDLLHSTHARDLQLKKSAFKKESLLPDIPKLWAAHNLCTSAHRTSTPDKVWEPGSKQYGAPAAPASPSQKASSSSVFQDRGRGAQQNEEKLQPDKYQRLLLFNYPSSESLPISWNSPLLFLK